MHSFSNPTGIYRSAKRVGRTFARCLNIYYQLQTFTDPLKKKYTEENLQLNFKTIFMLEFFSNFIEILDNFRACFFSFGVALKNTTFREKLMWPSTFDRSPNT